VPCQQINKGKSNILEQQPEKRWQNATHPSLEESRLAKRETKQESRTERDLLKKIKALNMATPQECGLCVWCHSHAGRWAGRWSSGDRVQFCCGCKPFEWSNLNKHILKLKIKCRKHKKEWRRWHTLYHVSQMNSQHSQPHLERNNHSPIPTKCKQMQGKSKFDRIYSCSVIGV